jgi:lipoprotein-anchoring transpeptidase ErfK/SrfK
MSNGKQSPSKRIWVSTVALAVLTSGGIALAQANQAAASGEYLQKPQVQAPASSKRLVLVSIPDRKLVLIEDGTVKRIYPVAVGKPTTPSPAGQFSIVRRVSDPTYSHHNKVVAPGPKNPVGSRWMGLSAKGYGIHGTNEPNSIGKAASHGCIRMSKADLEELYSLVQVGDAVEIHAQHDTAVTLALGEAVPSAPSLPATTAPGNQILVAGNTPAVQSTQGQ